MPWVAFTIDHRVAVISGFVLCRAVRCVHIDHHAIVRKCVLRSSMPHPWFAIGSIAFAFTPLRWISRVMLRCSVIHLFEAFHTESEEIHCTYYEAEVVDKGT